MHSWVEDTIDRKRKRRDEGAPYKDTPSLSIFFGSTLRKVKK